MDKECYEQLTKEIERLWDAIHELDEQRSKWQLKYDQMMQLAYGACKPLPKILVDFWVSID